MKVLMFGWEFPPFNTGGLGTACYGLTKGLANNNVDVTFVVPQMPEKVNAEFVKLISAKSYGKANIKFRMVKTPLAGYMTPEEYKVKTALLTNVPDGQQKLYGDNIFMEAQIYAEKAAEIAKTEPHDVIHAHDWMTYMAGLAAKKVSGKPLVVHVHATEFDRGGGNGVNQAVYDLERKGMHEADAICSVSEFTKNKIIEHYGVDPNKINVVHNAVEFNDHKFVKESFGLSRDSKVVLFLGRITLQKGPEYFLYAAKKVLEQDPNIKFVVAGTGDMHGMMIEKAAELGIGENVLFTGFLKGKDIDKAYQMADLYVMPSVSEPFGITPLESMRNNTPVLISKQSGVSEVVNHVLKVDFWDVDKMANQICAILKYGELHNALMENGNKEVQNFSWNIPAEKCLHVYNKLLENKLINNNLNKTENFKSLKNLNQVKDLFYSINRGVN